MKLATLKNETRDGQLIVVSKDLTRAAVVPGIQTLQQALDNWDENQAVLQKLYQALEKTP